MNVRDDTDPDPAINIVNAGLSVHENVESGM